MADRDNQMPLESAESLKPRKRKKGRRPASGGDSSAIDDKRNRLQRVKRGRMKDVQRGREKDYNVHGSPIRYPMSTTTTTTAAPTTTTTTTMATSSLTKRYRKKKRDSKKRRKKRETFSDGDVFQLDDGFANGFNDKKSPIVDSRLQLPLERSGEEVGSEFATTTTTTTTAASGTVALEEAIAVDCEMVGVGWKMESALARCSIVDASGAILMDTYVIPPSGVSSITDYRTPYSGVRPCHMRGATPFHDVVSRVRRLFEGKIIVGHGVKSDFDALGFAPPENRVRDTSKYPHLFQLARESEAQVRASSPCGSLPKLCQRLKSLARFVLGRTIQTGKGGHDSVEDARATMDLYLTVRERWESELWSDKTRLASIQKTKKRTATTSTETTTTTATTTTPVKLGKDTRRDAAIPLGSLARGDDAVSGGVVRGGNNNNNSYEENGSSVLRGRMKSSSSDVSVDSSVTSPLRGRSRTVTVTSEEISEFADDRFWTEFPDDPVIHDA